MNKNTEPSLNIIVCVDEAGGIGKSGKMPWHYPEDLSHFKFITSESSCIMGRYTYSDILEMRMGRANQDYSDIGSEILPGRTSYVLSRMEHYLPLGATRCSQLHEAVNKARDSDRKEIFVIGGESVFKEALPHTKKIYLTRIKGKSFGCDRFFDMEYLDKHFYLASAIHRSELTFSEYMRN